MLQNTKQLMDRYLAERALDSYAVVIFDRGRRDVICSDNVNELTYFDIASMGKVLVTSTLILQAVEENKLSLQDPLQKFFSPIPDDKKGITVQQLLTHTSGILRNADVITEKVVRQGRDAIAAAILREPLGFVPDTKVVYSCSGYVLLGLIAEKVFGAPLDAVFYERIHRPLGLERTAFDIPIHCDNAVHSYTRREVGTCRSDDTIAYRMQGVAGNGASFWCLKDVETFIRGILQYELLSPTLSAMAETNHTPTLEQDRGLGYLVVEDRYCQTGRLFPSGSFGHCGHTGTSFFIHRESGRYAILLTNATRHQKIRNGWHSNYPAVILMREDIHNTILSDLL